MAREHHYICQNEYESYDTSKPKHGLSRARADKIGQQISQHSPRLSASSLEIGPGFKNKELKQ
jgi:hypothetical protein